MYTQGMVIPFDKQEYRQVSFYEIYFYMILLQCNLKI